MLHKGLFRRQAWARKWGCGYMLCMMQIECKCKCLEGWGRTRARYILSCSDSTRPLGRILRTALTIRILISCRCCCFVVFDWNWFRMLLLLVSVVWLQELVVRIGRWLFVVTFVVMWVSKYVFVVIIGWAVICASGFGMGVLQVAVRRSDIQLTVWSCS